MQVRLVGSITCVGFGLGNNLQPKSLNDAKPFQVGDNERERRCTALIAMIIDVGEPLETLIHLRAGAEEYAKMLGIDLSEHRMDYISRQIIRDTK